MTVLQIPDELNVVRQVMGITSFDAEFANSESGASQVAVMGPPRRTCSFVSNEREAEAEVIGAWRALVHAMRGRVRRVAVYDIQRPHPWGSARGVWTLAAPAAAGAATLTLSVGAGQDGTTLTRGDWIGVGQDSEGPAHQLLHVQAGAVVEDGLLVVSFEPVLRVALSNGAPVVWDRPTCLMRRTTADTQWTGYPADMVGGFSLDLMEAWE